MKLYILESLAMDYDQSDMFEGVFSDPKKAMRHRKGDWMAGPAEGEWSMTRQVNNWTESYVIYPVTLDTAFRSDEENAQI